ncbi:MAG TPA: hypothetical protein VFU82_05405 [Gammaproteobacteria bacterium]|jgi:hypothetical protein|nr:hypothetical protein [Gammaproteobacteria bacterium]
MAVRDIFKISRKTFLNPSGWLDLNGLIEQNKTIWSVLKNLFTKVEPTRQETFEQAMVRQGLAEADIPRLMSRFALYVWLFLGCGLAAFAYAFYLLFAHHLFLGWLLSMSVSAFFATQAFRYDFWGLQLRRRTLGLSFADWKKSRLGE